MASTSATAMTVMAPWKILVLAALFPESSSSLTVGGAANCVTGYKCPCTRSAPGAATFAPSRQAKIRPSVGLGTTSGVSSGSDDIASSVRRLKGSLPLSERWGSVLPSDLRISGDVERKLRGIDDTRAPSIHPLDGQQGADLNFEFKDKKWILLAGCVALALVLGVSFLLGAWANAALAGVITLEAMSSLAVVKMPAVGGRAGVVVRQISVVIAAFRERIVGEPAAKYVRERVAPVALETLRKMLLMEFWRRVWVVVFSKTRKGLHYIGGKATKLWTSYCPFWIQRGFQQIFKKAVEKRVQASVTLLFGSVSSRAGNMLKQYWYHSEASSFASSN